MMVMHMPRASWAAADSGNFVVPDENACMVGLQVPGELFNKVDRAVSAAGTADGNRDVGSVFAHEFRQPPQQEAADVIQHAAGFDMLFEVVGDRTVAPGQFAQGRLPVGI